jgi:hypothetical protein
LRGQQNQGGSNITDLIDCEQLQNQQTMITREARSMNSRKWRFAGIFFRMAGIRGPLIIEKRMGMVFSGKIEDIVHFVIWTGYVKRRSHHGRDDRLSASR